MTLRIQMSLLAACSLYSMTGCDQGPHLAPVTGVVQVNGGPPPGAGFIIFAPTEQGPSSIVRPGKADFGLDGAFSASSFEKGDGLAPGTYSVRITCWKEPPSVKNLDGVSYVPPDYQPQELVVDEDGVEVTYDIPVANP